MPITLTTIHDGQRPNFPVKWFKDPLFDLKVFTVADQLLKGYKGGLWDYVETDLVGFMRSPHPTNTLISPYSGEEYVVDDNLAGMIITIYAISSTFPHSDRLDELHGDLIDLAYAYAEETGQESQAFGMLD